jgi:TOBE domain
MVRPEQIELVRDGSGARAKVAGVTFYGPDTVVELTLDAVAAPISARVLRGHDVPRAGTPVGLRVVGPVMAYRTGEVAGTASPAETQVGERS